MKVFDCFSFFNELEILELRLMEHYDYVDYFVISEANKSHNGTPKAFIFEKNKDMFEKWMDKIIYVKVEDMPNYCPRNVFKLEYFQRDATARGLKGLAEPGDKVIVSDCDEILNVEGIKANLNNENKVLFSQGLFYYFVNVKFHRAWCRPVMAPYGSFKRPNDLRNFSQKFMFRRRGPNVVENGGWHYSYMTGGDARRIRDKVALFAQKDMARKAGSVEQIEKRVREKKDLFGRNHYNVPGGINVVDISNDKPRNLDKWLEKYPDFIYKE